MAYTKKTWVNVPDPSKFTDDELNSFPRYDAENMNRMEDGIDEAVNHIDVSLTHLNSKNNPHNVTTGQIGAFPTGGGTLTGDIKIQKTEQPLIQLGTEKFLASIFKNASATKDYGLTIKDCEDRANPDSHIYLRISHSQAKKALAEALKLGVFENAESGRFYNIYGDHNAQALGVCRIKRGSYTGNGTYNSNVYSGSVSIPCGEMPKMIIIKGTGEPYSKLIAFALPNPTSSGFYILVMSGGWSSSFIPRESSGTYDGTYINFNATKSEDLFLNNAGTSYSYVLLY